MCVRVCACANDTDRQIYSDNVAIGWITYSYHSIYFSSERDAYMIHVSPKITSNKFNSFEILMPEDWLHRIIFGPLKLQHIEYSLSH